MPPYNKKDVINKMVYAIAVDRKTLTVRIPIRLIASENLPF